MQLDIETLQKDQNKYHDIFLTLMKETKATILKKITEIEDSLEIQANKLETRLVHLVPILGQQDRHFPAIDKLDYDNYLVTINSIREEY